LLLGYVSPFPFAEFFLDEGFELFVELLLFVVALGELLVEDAEVADVLFEVELHNYNGVKNSPSVETI
jgi:hypothetical protein